MRPAHKYIPDPVFDSLLSSSATVRYPVESFWPGKRAHTLHDSTSPSSVLILRRHCLYVLFLHWLLRVLVPVWSHARDVYRFSPVAPPRSIVPIHHLPGNKIQEIKLSKCHIRAIFKTSYRFGKVGATVLPLRSKKFNLLLLTSLDDNIRKSAVIYKCREATESSPRRYCINQYCKSPSRITGKNIESYVEEIRGESWCSVRRKFVSLFIINFSIFANLPYLSSYEYFDDGEPACICRLTYITCKATSIVLSNVQNSHEWKVSG